MSDSSFVDCDVHPYVRGKFFEGLSPYLSADDRKHFDNRTSLPEPRYKATLGTFIRDTGFPDANPGVDPKFVAGYLLDRHNTSAAMLIPPESNFMAVLPSADDTTVIATALNDYFIDQWLPVDPRYRYSMGVSPKDPAASAAEIRRLAANDQIISVFLPLTDILLGNRHFYPIYEAALENGLPIVTHPGAGEGDFGGCPPLPGGQSSFFVERNCLFPTVAQANVVSLIFEGVFERFPGLKFAFIEWGFSWVPYLMWRMDSRWRGLRTETPWVRHAPSQYLLENIRFTTQPMDEPEKESQELASVMEAMHAERTLLFATDYPHWDNDYPERTMERIPQELKQRMMVDNALETFGRLHLPVLA